ncbi:phage virion morphogenesis protein [Uliginosibacterium gangwonense]|uniref:phage virion morphogenesis protein n=1 Tax=Uliginosibacterium gangwonense TaxID=392736 RepID=UPI00037D0C9C|nr:phage virion morphogenesis protein [Uliginosibacterium gangwonense]
MSDELAPLEASLAGLIAHTSDTARRQMARELASKLRTTQAKRIATQQNPDGSPYAPRTSRLAPQGRIRAKLTARKKRGQMFKKLRTTKYLKVEANPNAATITFKGPVQAMARVHQFGLKDRVSRRLGALTVKYPARQLLGITQAERAAVENIIVEHLAK